VAFVISFTPLQPNPANIVSQRSFTADFNHPPPNATGGRLSPNGAHYSTFRAGMEHCFKGETKKYARGFAGERRGGKRPARTRPLIHYLRTIWPGRERACLRRPAGAIRMK
jgi:hypothetical protein